MDASISYFDVLFVKCGVIGWVEWALSVVTVAVIIRFFVTIRRARLVPSALAERAKASLARKQHRELAELAASDGSLLGGLLHAGLSQSAHGYAAMVRAMEDDAQTRVTKLLRQIEWLNLIGNVAPMLGLLGTVWGMILAFFTIVAKGGIPHPGDLAGAIGTALVTTLQGLMMAIPALSVYATMRNRVDTLTEEAMALCQDLLSGFQAARPAVIALTAEDKQAAGA